MLYRESPVSSKQHSLNPFAQHPRTLFPLFSTELWERFSFYGIRPLIVLLLIGSLQHSDFGFDRPTASAISGIFAGIVYFLSLPGGWLAGNYLGPSRAVWWGSILIACGHLSIALSAFFGHISFFAGLTLIALGTGLFKTCISILVGHLYTADDKRRDGGYMLFYMGINIGAFIAPLLTGWLAQQYGWHIGFGIGGIGMLIALLVFRFFVQPALPPLDTPPRPLSKSFVLALLGVTVLALVSFYGLCYWLGVIKLLSYMAYALGAAALTYYGSLFLDKTLSSTEKRKLLVCGVLFIAGTIFWAALEQKSLGLTLFVEDFVQRQWFGQTIPSSWFFALDPLFIILLAPVLSVWVQRRSHISVNQYLGKAAVSLSMTALSFFLLFIAAKSIIATNTLLSPLWIVFIYALQSASELLISPISLAAISLLAPQRLQGQMMGLWFITASLGNLISGMLGGEISRHHLAAVPAQFGQTTLWLAGAAILLLVLIPLFKQKFTPTTT